MLPAGFSLSGKASSVWTLTARVVSLYATALVHSMSPRTSRQPPLTGCLSDVATKAFEQNRLLCVSLLSCRCSIKFSQCTQRLQYGLRAVLQDQLVVWHLITTHLTARFDIKSISGQLTRSLHILLVIILKVTSTLLTGQSTSGSEHL